MYVGALACRVWRGLINFKLLRIARRDEYEKKNPLHLSLSVANRGSSKLSFADVAYFTLDRYTPPVSSRAITIVRENPELKIERIF